MADLNATFVQEIFNITERERKPNIKHHSQADDLWARFEVPEWSAFCHTARLRNRLPRLKLVSSDNAGWGVLSFKDATTHPASSNQV